MNKPTLSIVIPAYNEEASIHTCLESIITQNQETFVLHEIIVISDGSQDKTASVARDFNSPIIRVIEHTTNKGMQERLNEGFREAQGDYLFKIDADLTLYNQDSLEIIMSSAQKSQTSGLIMFREYLKPQNIIESYLFFWDTFRKKVLHQLSEEFFILRVTGSYLLTKDIYQNLTISDDIVEEDHYVLLNVLAQGKKVQSLESPLIRGNYLDSWEHVVRQYARYTTTTINSKHFSPELLQKYKPLIPKKIIFATLFKHFLTRPHDILHVILRIWIGREASVLKKENPIQRTW